MGQELPPPPSQKSSFQQPAWKILACFHHHQWERMGMEKCDGTQCRGSQAAGVPGAGDWARAEGLQNFFWGQNPAVL